MSAGTVEALLEYLREVRLTKAEKLQILNLLPRSEVEFYLVSQRGGLIRPTNPFSSSLIDCGRVRGAL